MNDDPARRNFRPLSGEQKADVDRAKALANDIMSLYRGLQTKYPRGYRELALGITRAEEASMWAVKGITA